MKIANKLSNKWWLLPTIVSSGLLMPKLAFAVSPFVTFLGDTIMQLIMSPAWLLLQLEMWLLPTIAKYNNFISEPGVVIGWTALRDVSNMMFILVLLVIAFATILRVKSYGYKQLLSRLIIVAILINFSRTFVGLAIDLSQVVMLTFVQAIKDVSTENLIVALGLSKTATAGTGLISFLAALILGAFMLVLAVVVIGVFIGMLAARIVTLWILTVLSPLAFLAYVFPRTQSFFNKWLSQLSSNLFSGPVLVFFLWLAFTITGRGDIYKGFVADNLTGSVGGIPVTDITTAASPSNVINYVIAMVLLVSSLKFVGASGAAGASLASKAHKGVTDYASKLARRYPMATLSRAGALTSRLFVNEEGEARKRLFGVIPNWNRFPFAGGQVQRAAQKMQGYDAARIKKQQEEDTKYITPMQKAAFLKSQATMGRESKSDFWRRTGRVYSLISSQGGNTDKDALLAAEMNRRGDVNDSNHKWVANQLRRTGQEEELHKIQQEFHDTFATQEEADRLVRLKGQEGVLKSFRGESYVKRDASGKIMKDDQGRNIVDDSILYLLKAVHDPANGHADPKSIQRLLLGNQKMDRYGFDSTKMQYFSALWGKKAREMSVANISEEGIEIGKRGEVSPDLDRAAFIAHASLAGDYPNMVVDKLDKQNHIVELGSDAVMTGRIYQDIQENRMKPGQVGSRVQRMPDETKAEFSKRKKELSELDTASWENQADLPDFIRARNFKDEEAFEKFRDDRIKQLTGMRPMLEDENGKKLISPRYWHDEDIFDSKSNMSDEEKVRAYLYRHSAPPSIRKDIAQQTDLAKESDEGKKAREELSSKSQKARDFVEEIEAKVKQVLPVYQSNWSELGSGFKADTIEYLRAKAVAERAGLSGNKNTMHDLASHSLWTEIDDGTHGSRGAEVNVGNWQEAAKLDHFIEPMENQQQTQMYAVSTNDQTEYLLKALVRLGKKPQKSIVENVGELLRAQGMQAYNDRKAMEDQNILPQDYSRYASELDKNLFVIKAQADDEKQTMNNYLKRNTAALERLTRLIAVYNSNPDHPHSINVANLDNDPIVLEMLQQLVDEDYQVQRAPKQPPQSKNKGGKNSDQEEAPKIVDSTGRPFDENSPS